MAVSQLVMRVTFVAPSKLRDVSAQKPGCRANSYVEQRSVRSAAAGPDGVRLFNGDDEHASVSALAGARGFNHGPNHVVDEVIGDDQVDHDFRSIANFVFMPAMNCG